MIIEWCIVSNVTHSWWSLHWENNCFHLSFFKGRTHIDLCSCRQSPAWVMAFEKEALETQNWKDASSILITFICQWEKPISYILYSNEYIDNHQSLVFVENLSKILEQLFVHFFLKKCRSSLIFRHRFCVTGALKLLVATNSHFAWVCVAARRAFGRMTLATSASICIF